MKFKKLNNLIPAVVVGILFSFPVFGQKEYVTFKGKIKNPSSGELLVLNPDKVLKIMNVSSKGVFSDTLHLPEGIYFIYDKAEFSKVYLKPGMNLNMTVNTKNFDESISYKGQGSEENNFLNKFNLEFGEQDFNKILALDSGFFYKTLQQIREKEYGKIDASKFSESFKLFMKDDLDISLEQIEDIYGQKLSAEKIKNQTIATYIFENHKGGTTNLNDLRGKYLYIDIWATWCGPCRKEIPHMKKLEADYHGKNIEFISISIDSPKDYEKWKAFVSNENMGGIQLYAQNAWEADIVRDFNIRGIPRFILIDPAGKIIDPDVERPSTEAIRKQFDELLK